MGKIDKVLEALFPPFSCITCGEELTEDCPLGVCPACLKKLSFNNGAVCRRCGRRVKSLAFYCASCRNARFDFDAAASALVYEGDARLLMLRFKFQEERYLAGFFADCMFEQLGREEWEPGLIVSVPMRPFAEWRRGYNQARLLADALARRCRIPAVEALAKSAHTKRQSRLAAFERSKNAAGAFRPVRALGGEDVLLVDDILTTGATASACAKALKKAGAGKVYVLTACATPERLAGVTDPIASRSRP